MVGIAVGMLLNGHRALSEASPDAWRAAAGRGVSIVGWGVSGAATTGWQCANVGLGGLTVARVHHISSSTRRPCPAMTPRAARGAHALPVQ